MAESLLALAFPPLRPPSRPSSTAAGFLPSWGSAPWSSGSVACATIAAAIEFRSRGLLDRFGICPSSPARPSRSTTTRIKLTHYRTTRAAATPTATCSAPSTTRPPTRHDPHTQPVRWTGGKLTRPTVDTKRLAQVLLDVAVQLRKDEDSKAAKGRLPGDPLCCWWI